MKYWRVPLLLALAVVLASCSESPGPAATAVVPGVVASFTPTSAPLPTSAPATVAPSPTDPSATPTPSPSAAPVPTPVPATTATPVSTATPTRIPTATPTPSPTPYPPSAFILPGFTDQYLSFQPVSVHFIRDFPDGIGNFVDRAVLEGRVRYGTGMPEVDLLWHLEGLSEVEWRFVLVDETAYLLSAVDGLSNGWFQSSPMRGLMNRIAPLLPPLPALLSWDFIENGIWELLDDGSCGGTPCHQFRQAFDDREIILAVDRASLRPLSISVRSGPADGRYTRATTEFVSWNEDLVLAPPDESEPVAPELLAYEFFWPLVLLGIESRDSGTLSLASYLIPSRP